MWSGLLAGVGALTTIVANRIATAGLVKNFDEETPEWWARSGGSRRPPPPRRAEPGGGATSPAEADRIAADEQDAFAAKPHVYALGAFAGAFAFAQILKRIFGDDDD